MVSVYNFFHNQTIKNFIVDGQEVAIEITKSQLHTISKFVEQILIKKIESALSIESSSSSDHHQLGE